MKLGKLLKLSIVNDFKILNPAAGMEDIPVEYVRIMEAPGEIFVRSCELAITSGLYVREDSQALHDYIYKLYTLHAAGIVFSLPKNDFSRLNPLLDEFAELGFPILSMDYCHLFGVAVEDITKAIWDEHTQNISSMEAMQHALLSGYLKGKSLYYAADILHQYLKSNILILDSSRHVRAFNQELSHIPESELYTQFSDQTESFKIGSEDHLYGCVLIEKEAFFQNLNTPAARQYLNVPLTLWFDREYTIIAEKMREKEEFVFRLAHDKSASAQELLERAAFLDFPTDCYYCCFAACTYLPRITEGIDSSGSRTAAVMIQECVLFTAQQLSRRAITSLKDSELIIFLETRAHTLPNELAESFLDQLENNIKNTVRRVHFLWGYDTVSYSFQNLHTGYEHAAAALNICQTSPVRPSRICFSRSITQQMLSLLVKNQELTATAAAIIHELRDSDQNKGTNYIETLKAYLQCNYNISETSRSLHMHRQSLLYRLEKIEELSGLSLKDHENLFILEVCIMITENMEP